MDDYKIVFTGPVGAGKTTAISSVSDIAPMKTEQLPTDETRKRKNATTVAMDYGIFNVEGKRRIHMYGTPGQERFNFMWDILSKGGKGLVLLVDNAHSNPFEQMRFYLNAFAEFINETRVVIGVTRMDLSAYPRIDDYHEVLSQSGLRTAVFDVDARVKQDVSILVESLVYSIAASDSQS